MNEPIQWSPGVTLEDIEKQVILYAFRWFRGNKTQTSISLGISIRTLETKLEKYENDGAKQREAEEREAATRIARLNRARGVHPNASTTEGAVFGTGAGLYAQPPAQAPAEHAVPVPEPEKVQSVLPAKAAASGKHQRR